MVSQVGPDLYKIVSIENALSQQTQNICITFVQRWSNIVQMLYKCFVFAGMLLLREPSTL